eukprot:197829_1
MAASQINTILEGEQGEQFNFDNWINTNGLSMVKNLLVKHNMKTINTLNTTSDEFHGLMSDPELLSNAQTIPKILSALKKTALLSESKSKVIVISEEEEQSIYKLDEYNKNISSLIKKLNNKNNELTVNIKECDSKIDSSFNYIHQQIDIKKNEIKNKLKNIEKEKRSEITAKSQKLNKEQIKIKNSIKSMDSLVQNGDVDRSERKNKIVSIYNNIKKEELSNNIVHVTTKIDFTFKKESISSFLMNVCDIDAESKHALPIIDQVQIKDITNSTATVHFNASLSKQDRNKKNGTKLYMKIECLDNEMDEKEKEVINSELIPYNLNTNNYKYQLKELQKGKNYTMNINVYESYDSNNKRNIKRTDFKSISIKFKTLVSDIDQHFVYQSDFDTNGICYALGSNYGKNAWQNPSDQGLINVTASTKWNNGSKKDIVSRTSVGNSNTDSVVNGWIMIDFTKLTIKPTAYSLRASDINGHFLRTWNLEGSQDGNNWDIIKSHTNDTSLNQ